MALASVNPKYKPHAKQMLLHNAPVSWEDIVIILFGGAKGGGKSAGILMDAVLFCTTYPGAKAMILRENLSAVKQSFLDKLPTLLPQYVYDDKGNKIQVYEYKEKGGRYPDRTIVFPNGSYITFQRVENYNEALAKQGWEVHYLGIDEVTKQEKRSVMYLLSLLRSAEVFNPYTGKPLRIPTKAVFGCNPGGPGHRWVKEMFIDTTVIEKDPITNAPLRTRDHISYIESPDGEDVKVTIRFIPARWEDNTNLSKSYRAILMMASEHKRKMDMDGNWDVVAGRMFNYEEDSFLHVQDALRLISNDSEVKDIYLSVDWGYNDRHSVLWHCVFVDTSVITFKLKSGRLQIFEEFVKEIAEMCEGLYITASLLPHDMFRAERYRDDSGKIIGETKSEVFEHYDLNPVSVMSGKGTVEYRYDKIHSASVLTMEREGKEIKRFRISRGCSSLINELNEAVYDDNNLTYIDSSCEDHDLDAFGLFLVYYSQDIAPLDLNQKKVVDARPKWERRLAEEEERLMQSDSSNRTIGLASEYDV